MNPKFKETKLWTAIISPMKEDASIDYEALKKLLFEQQEAGNGILLLGSTGESLNLSERERREYLDFALSLGLTAPLMVGVGGVNLEETKEWVEYVSKLPIDALLLVTPLYAKPGTHGQYHWFKTLLDATNKACMLYNVPGRTAKALDWDALRKLDGHPNFWSIKEASGNPDHFKAYTEAAPKAKVFSGDDPLLPAFVPHGCAGLVSVASNVWPKATHQYTERAIAKKLSSSEIELWKKSTNALFLDGNPVTPKALMALLGRIPGPTCRAPLSHLDFSHEKEVLAANDDINTWLKGL